MKMGADAPILDRHQARQNIDFFNTIRTKLTLTPRRSMAAFNGGIFRESTSGGNWASESKVTFPFGPFKVPTSGNHFNRQDFIPTTEQPKNLKKEGVKISWRNEPHWQ